MINMVVNFLILLSEYLGNLGWAILALTLFIKVVLYPINKTALASSIKMKELQPELKKLQKKYQKQPQKLQKKQMELYQKAGVNPLGGCLPQIFQLGVVIILYRALISLLGTEAVSNGAISTHFLGLDLRQSDPYYVLPILAASSQFIASWLMMGKYMDKTNNSQKQLRQNKSRSKSKTKKEENLLDSTQMMQQQMIYVMPIMTGIIASRFPAGISLYWVTSTMFSVFQQWMIMNKHQRHQASASIMTLLKLK